MKKFTDYIAEKDPVQSEVFGKMWNAAKQAVGMGGQQYYDLPKNEKEVQERLKAGAEQIEKIGLQYFDKGEKAYSKAFFAAADFFRKQYPVEVQKWKRKIDMEMGRIPQDVVDNKRVSPPQQPATRPPGQNLMQQGR